MKLADVIKNIITFNDEETIYAVEPWSPKSDAFVCKEPEDGCLPKNADRMSHFLEVFIVNEFIEDWPEVSSKSTEQICERIISYAINDA